MITREDGSQTGVKKKYWDDAKVLYRSLKGSKEARQTFANYKQGARAYTEREWELIDDIAHSNEMNHYVTEFDRATKLMIDVFKLTPKRFSGKPPRQ